MSKLRFATIITLVVVALAGCQTGSAKSDGPSDVQEVPRMTPRELKSMLDAGENVVIVDTRSYASYEADHIAGAGSIPYDEIDARYGELPKGLTIVLYCT